MTKYTDDTYLVISAANIESLSDETDNTGDRTDHNNLKLDRI